MSAQIPLAITPGEPAGIGPDLCVQLVHSGPLPYPAVFLADPDLLQERGEKLGLPVRIREFKPGAYPEQLEPGDMVLAPGLKLNTPAQAGVLDKRNSEYVLATLSEACDGCIKGQYSALVTGPVHKGIINEARIPFTGHTEFLAERCGGYPVMMLATEGLRVALATTHVPLGEVCHHINKDLLFKVLRILHRDLVTKFGLPKPRILVCGINPHAGEGGHLGLEEIYIIEPVLKALREEGMDLIGPLPADTLFTPPNLAKADAVLAMYHDQGLPVLKYKGFGRAVNITLGLPIIRTSVDHGTALDLAGTGKADLGSLKVALDTAVELINRSREV